MSEDDRDLIEELGEEPFPWQWIVVIAMLVGTLLVAIKGMLPSKGVECPEGEICGD